MKLLYGIAIVTLSAVFFRWIFTKTRFRDYLWEFVGRWIPIHKYAITWIIMTVIIVVAIQTLMDTFVTNEIIVDFIYILSFTACFALMPGLDVKDIDKVDM